MVGSELLQEGIDFRVVGLPPASSAVSVKASV
jgi:hypothetical protein